MPSRLRTVKVLMREHARVSRVDRVATRTFELENPRTVMVYKIPALGNGKIQKKALHQSCLYPERSCHLPRHKRVPSTQPPIHRPRLPIDVATLVTPQEERNPRNLISMPAPAQRIQLPNLPLRAARPCRREHRRRHARLNESRTQRIHPDPRAGELKGDSLRQRNHGRLGRRVGRAPGVGAEARNRRRGDDAPRGSWFLR